MSEDNNNKDEKEYFFIQEHIASKKKCKIKRMFHSVAWTIMLACIFGVVAGVVFCISVPAFNKILGKYQDKKTVEFPTNTPDDSQPTPTGGLKEEDNANTDTVGTEGEKNGQTTEEPDTVVIEKFIEADLQDLSNIYLELRNIAGEVGNSIVNVTSISSGVDALFNSEIEAANETTGLVIANNGADLLILVSYDKIQEAKDIKINFTESLQVKAKLQDYDSALNLAVIAVSLEDIPDTVLDNIKPVTLGESYALIVGAPVLALGSPNGYVDSMELGIITSKGLSKYITDNVIELFTTDINYNENGEGVIVNLQGEVIGIITQKLKDDYNKEVNTVIGISKIKAIIQSLVNHTDRSYFGIKGADMTEAALAQTGIANGIFVTEVETDSPALEAGLQSGDMILAVNDTPVISVNTFYSLISACKPKDTVKVTIWRDSKNSSTDKNIEVTLGRKNGK